MPHFAVEILYCHGTDTPGRLSLNERHYHSNNESFKTVLTMSQKKVSKNGAFSRRDFLKTGALSGVALGSGTLLGGCTSNNGETRPGDAKNIIFMVSDGMSIGTLTAADHMLRRHYGRPSHWISLYEQKRANRCLDVAAERPQASL